LGGGFQGSVFTGGRFGGEVKTVFLGEGGEGYEKGRHKGAGAMWQAAREVQRCGGEAERSELRGVRTFER
jgi:hypothetical protein